MTNTVPTGIAIKREQREWLDRYPRRGRSRVVQRALDVYMRLWRQYRSDTAIDAALRELAQRDG